MKRIRQESAEVYEVTGLDILKALGICCGDDDRVFIERRASQTGDIYKIRVEFHENEEIEIDTPDMRPTFELPGLAVIIPGPNGEPIDGILNPLMTMINEAEDWQLPKGPPDLGSVG